MTLECTDVWAVPGALCIIDQIHPVTGLTIINGNDAAGVLARLRAGYAAREWLYRVVMFLLVTSLVVGEPDDHDISTGRPRFQAYWHLRDDVYMASSRPVTVAEIKQALHARP